ncbi:MAG: ArsR/SmtB family transcription factor [Halapricum sp.]
MAELRDDWIYDRQADLCQVFSNPKRLKLLELLKDGNEYTVSHLQEETDIPQSTVSRHLQLMRDRGVVGKRDDGIHSHYSLTDDRIATGMALMREILFAQLGDDQRTAAVEQ